MARKKDELGTREKTIHFRVSEAFYEVIAHEAMALSDPIPVWARSFPVWKSMRSNR